MENEEILGKALLIQWKNGNDEVYDEIYKLYFPIVYYRALNFFCDTDKAQDATQNIMLEIYTKFKDLRNIQAFPAWVKTITYRKCINMTTYDKKDSLYYSNDQEFNYKEQVQKESTIHQIHIKDAVCFIEEELKMLEEPKKTIAILYFLEGYSAKEISEFLDININTIFSHIHRVRKALIKKLENKNFSIQECLSATCLPLLSSTYQDYVIDSSSTLNIKSVKQKTKKVRFKHNTSMIVGNVVIGCMVCLGVVSVVAKEKGIEQIEDIFQLHNKTEIQSITYTDKITKKDVKIHIKTTNDDYDQMLINGKKTTSITTNGVYQIAILIDGKELDSKQIVIDNIDKSGPYIAEKKDNENDYVLRIEDNDAIDYEKTSVYVNGEYVNMNFDKESGSITLRKERNTSYHFVVYDQVGNISDFYVNFYE